MSNVVHATEQDFKEIIESNKLVLVDFFATWCGPCKMLGPEIERLAEETEGSVVIVKVNVDEEQALAQRYGVMSIPTLYVFKDAEIVKHTAGYQPYDQLKQLLGS